MGANGDVCRLCLAEEPPLKSVFSVEQYRERPSQISDVIMSCSSVQICKDDGLPESVCTLCVREVRRMASFRSMCEQSDASLREKFKKDTPAAVPEWYVPVKSERLDLDEEEQVDPNCYTVNLGEMQVDFKIETEDHQPASSPQLPPPSELLTENPRPEEFLQLQSPPPPINDSISLTCMKCGYSSFDLHDYQDHIAFCEANEFLSLQKDDDEQQRAPASSSLPSKQSTSWNKCELCEKNFRTWQSLKHHQQMAHGTFNCDVCNANFPSLLSLEKHKSLYHARPTGKTFVAASTAAQKDAEFRCEVCGKEFSMQTSLAHHRRHCSGAFRCTVCDKTFATPRILHLHMQSVHRQGKKPFDCPVCGKEFLYRSVLIIHLQTHQRGVKKGESYGCEICGKAFSYYASYSNHCKKHETNQIAPPRPDGEERKRGRPRKTDAAVKKIVEEVAKKVVEETAKKVVEETAKKVVEEKAKKVEETAKKIVEETPQPKEFSMLIEKLSKNNIILVSESDSNRKSLENNPQISIENISNNNKAVLEEKKEECEGKPKKLDKILETLSKNNIVVISETTKKPVQKATEVKQVEATESKEPAKEAGGENNGFTKRLRERKCQVIYNELLREELTFNKRFRQKMNELGSSFEKSEKSKICEIAKQVGLNLSKDLVSGVKVKRNKSVGEEGSAKTGKANETVEKAVKEEKLVKEEKADKTVEKPKAVKEVKVKEEVKGLRLRNIGELLGDSKAFEMKPIEPVKPKIEKPRKIDAIVERLKSKNGAVETTKVKEEGEKAGRDDFLHKLTKIAKGTIKEGPDVPVPEGFLMESFMFKRVKARKVKPPKLEVEEHDGDEETSKEVVESECDNDTQSETEDNHPSQTKWLRVRKFNSTYDDVSADHTYSAKYRITPERERSRKSSYGDTTDVEDSPSKRGRRRKAENKKTRRKSDAIENRLAEHNSVSSRGRLRKHFINPVEMEVLEAFDEEKKVEPVTEDEYNPTSDDETFDVKMARAEKRRRGRPRKKSSKSARTDTSEEPEPATAQEDGADVSEVEPPRPVRKTLLAGLKKRGRPRKYPDNFDDVEIPPPVNVDHDKLEEYNIFDSLKLRPVASANLVDVPPANLIDVPPKLVDVPPNLVDVPPANLVDIPPANLVDVPPNLVDIPPNLVDIPPNLVDVPPANLVDVPPANLVDVPPANLANVPPTIAGGLTAVKTKKKRTVCCWQCGETYKSLLHLQRHRKQMHSCESAFKCRFCDKSFLFSSTLFAHRQSHGFGPPKKQRKPGRRPYKCNERFRGRKTLRQHNELLSKP